MKTLTHVEKVRQENLQIKAQVQQLLGWSDYDYGEFQEATGYLYLDKEIGLTTPLVKELAYTKEFWSWFINQWVKRDNRFLRDVMIIGTSRSRSIYCKERIQGTYKQYHNPTAILFSPHKTTMQESYSRMISKLNKRVVND